MTFSGDLPTVDLSEVLRMLAQQGQTGTLVARKGRVEKTIAIREGVIISCASTDPKEFLGRYLVAHGLLSESELADTIWIQDEQSSLLGSILVQKGSVDVEDLREILRLKAEESILDLLSWQEGHFDFQTGQLPAYDLVPLAPEFTALIVSQMATMEDWAEIRSGICSTLAVPVAVSDLLDDPDLDLNQRAVLRAVDDNRSVEEICLHSRTSFHFACHTLAEKVQEGRLKVVRPRQVTPSAEAADAWAIALLADARGLHDLGDFDRSWRYLQAARTLRPEDANILQLISALERDLDNSLQRHGIRPDSVPVVSMTEEQLKMVGLSAEEGFLLSRVDGKAMIIDIVQSSPIPEVEAQMTILKLVRIGCLEIG